jgi:hypothetical protein
MLRDNAGTSLKNMRLSNCHQHGSVNCFGRCLRVFLRVSEGLRIIDAKRQAMDPILSSTFRYLKAKYLKT